MLSCLSICTEEYIFFSKRRLLSLLLSMLESWEMHASVSYTINKVYIMIIKETIKMFISEECWVNQIVLSADALQNPTHSKKNLPTQADKLLSEAGLHPGEV